MSVWYQRIRDFFGCRRDGDETEEEQKDAKPQLSKRQEAIKSAEWKKEISSAVSTQIIEGVKVAMATLLSIFVPQFCSQIVDDIEVGTTCTLEENFSNLTNFNKFVIAWNFITLGLFWRLSYVLNKREAYLIKHLDDSRDHPYNSFVDNCSVRPKIVKRVVDFNKRMRFWTLTTVSAFAFNILVSCILIFYYYYDGFRSVTTLLANVLLVASKLYSYFDICEECRQAKPLALSAIKSSAVSYNVLDEAYKPVMKRRSTCGGKSDDEVARKSHDIRSSLQLVIRS